MSKQDNTSSWKKTWNNQIFFWMLFLTIVWFILLPLSLYWTTPCQSEFPFYMLFPRYLSCRTSNELGDFLAGAFAPVAFIWLAGAVLIQARELKEQREVLLLQKEELRLTRDEMEASRDVMKQQAKEAKATTKYIGEQTAFLKHEAELKISQEADKQLGELIKILSSTLDRISTFDCDFRIWGEDISRATFIVSRPSWSDVRKIVSISDAHKRASGLSGNDPFLNVGRMTLSSSITDEFEGIVNILDTCDDLQDTMSNTGLAKFGLFKLDEAQRAIELMIKASNLPDPILPELD